MMDAGGARSEFTYDGLGRRAAIMEKNASGTITSTKQYLWVGTALAEERAADGTTVNKRFYNQGEQIGETAYYYTKDHLGSVREMTDSSGTVQARYDYDPYGRVTKIVGSLDSDLRYAGYYQHAPSGLSLTLFRAYDSNTGKWLSRDPIGESAGTNIYEYVQPGKPGWRGKPHWHYNRGPKHLQCGDDTDDEDNPEPPVSPLPPAPPSAPTSGSGAGAQAQPPASPPAPAPAPAPPTPPPPPQSWARPSNDGWNW